MLCYSWFESPTQIKIHFFFLYKLFIKYLYDFWNLASSFSACFCFFNFRRSLPNIIIQVLENVLRDFLLISVEICWNDFASAKILQLVFKYFCLFNFDWLTVNGFNFFAQLNLNHISLNVFILTDILNYVKISQIIYYTVVQVSLDIHCNKAQFVRMKIKAKTVGLRLT